MSYNSKTQDTNIVCFGKDTRLFICIYSHSDCSMLQSDVNKIYNWASTNNMLFNNSKCSHSSYSFSKQSYKNIMIYINPIGNAIDNYDLTKDVGIIVDEDLNFSKRINLISRNCRQLRGWILRSFTYGDETNMLTLFRSMVSCRMDCGCQLWTLYKISDIKVLESVSFTKLVNGMRNLSYAERLKSLKMYSHQGLCDKYSAIYLWRIAEKQVPNMSESLEFMVSERRSSLFKVKHIPPGHLCTLCGVFTGILLDFLTFFQNISENLLNVLPRYLKNIFDIFLKTII